MHRRAILLAWLSLLLSAGAVGQAGSAHVGYPLAPAEDWQIVYANCSGCHSLQLVVAQRGDRDTWLRLIRWMQATQNLWEFDPAVEGRILDYLASNYPPVQTSRRAPLPAHLLPPSARRQSEP